MKRLLLVFALFVLAAAGVGVFRAMRLESRQVPPGTPSAIVIDAARAADRLAAAISIPTISWGDVSRRDAAAFTRFHDYLAAEFPNVARALTREVVAEHSLLYTWPSAGTAPPIVLTAHLDVVPATDDGWTRPPFAGAVEAGRIHGRGALDDKTAVVGILEAVEALLARGFTPARPIYLAFGHNEEGGGDASGAAAIAALLKARGVKNGWVLDEGGLIYDRMPGVSQPVALVGIAEKGYLNLELRVDAAGGHSSMPPRETAVGILARALDRIERQPMPARLDGAARATFEHLAGDMSLPLRFVIANLAVTRPLLIQRLAASAETNALIRTTAAPTMLAGSQKANVLATTARAIVNFRLLPGDTVESVTAHVARAIGDPRVSLTVAAEGAAEATPASPTNTPEFAALASSIRAVYPNVLVAPFLTIAATDARHYRDISSGTYRFLPIHQADATTLIHGVNEYVTVDGYAQAIRFYATLIETLAR
ncbi:MAG TPA: M20/M25/M40 family metallo-hydrolase [Vicinamibacterales bacterium]|nr:M20/M25/M40 family metallo-hydrolase [Vicinamibacterales bacterium]